MKYENFEWQPMYKASAHNKDFCEVLKEAPAQYMALYIRADTGNCAELATFKTENLAQVYCDYKNKHM